MDTRLEMQLTQVELSKAARIGQSALSSLETGETLSPQAGTLLRLAAALRVEPTWLQTGEGPRRPDEDAAEWDMRELWARLTPGNRRVLMDAARGMIAGQPERAPGIDDPFPKAKRSAKST